MVYNERLTFGSVIERTMLALFLFILSAMFSQMILYISTLHSKLKSFNSENIKLLDGMHEGLLILSKTQKTVMFCNKPSQKFLEAAIHELRTSFSSTAAVVDLNFDNDATLLRQKLFTPIKLAVKDQVSKFQELLNNNSHDKISLD